MDAETLKQVSQNLKRFLISGWRAEMSSRSSRLTDSHHSTLHAFFLAARESGYTEFELKLVTTPKGRVKLCVSPQRALLKSVPNLKSKRQHDSSRRQR